MLKRRNKKSVLSRRKDWGETPNKNPWYWSKIIGESDICYVCDKEIRMKKIRIKGKMSAAAEGALPVYIGVHPLYEGVKIYRHSRCHPLTTVWQKKFGNLRRFEKRIDKWKAEKGKNEEEYSYIPISDSVPPKRKLLKKKRKLLRR